MSRDAETRFLHRFVIAAGLTVAALFVFVGLATKLQEFGDGSIFSYAVAAQDSWAFHWHNISGRVFTYLVAYVPAEEVIALTGNARAGITAYGLIFFAAPLVGLGLTRALDPTPARTLFFYACLSTLALMPFVYGAPTEMWMAHALFWPALALTLRTYNVVVLFSAFTALVLTHEGAVVFVIATVIILFWRDGFKARLWRVGLAVAAALVVWFIVKASFPPDDYIASVLGAAAWRFIDPRNLLDPVCLLLIGTLVAYGALYTLIRNVKPTYAAPGAALICVIAVAIYWLRFDHALLAEARYNLRTVLLGGTPLLGLAAMFHDRLQRLIDPRLVMGAVVLTLTVHAVETAKFITGWEDYRFALRDLSTGTASDPDLGNPRFVSSVRLGPQRNRLAWNSTTPFLTVLLAPGFDPARLVIDPTAGYFWLSCATARQSERDSHALPADSRALIRSHACLHRP